VVLDMTVPEMNGLEAARAIREASPETEVLSLSIHFSEEIARVASRRGARLRAEIRRKLGTNCGGPALATGQTVFYEAARQLHGRLLRPRSLRLKHRRIAAWSAAHDPEVEFVRLLANGKSNKEAAAMLDVSTRTIENHRDHIMHKMEFTSFSNLIRFAVRNNLVEP
jgi:DNA-binding NarL/FixJ family response regulator